MIKAYRNIDLNNPVLITGMKVKEIATGKIAKITGIYEDDDQIWLVSGHDIAVIKISEFWNFFELIKMKNSKYVLISESNRGKLYVAKDSHIGFWTSNVKYAKKFDCYQNANSERKLLSFMEPGIKNISIVEVIKNDFISISN